MQNLEASFQVIVFSTFSAALALDVQVYIDFNKPQSILESCHSRY